MDSAKVSSGEATLDDVKRFWEANPLFAGETTFEPGTREFFIENEKNIIDDNLAGVLDDFYFEDIPGDRVLDVGCGTGFWVRHFSQRGFQVYAVDLTRKSVELTRRSIELFSCRAQVAVGNAEAIPFGNQSFDHVNCQGVIHHTPNTEACITEFFRVLKPGGTLCFSVYYRNFILSSPRLFRLISLVCKVIPVGLRGRGREGLVADALSIEDLVRNYDGRSNPLGKCFCKSEILDMARPHFEIRNTYRHLFPKRALPFFIPGFAHRFLHKHFGLMLVVRAKKRAN